MNAVEIEEAVSTLVEQPFDPAEFPFAFLAERRYNTTALFSDDDDRALRALLRRYLRSVLWSPWRSEAAMFDPLHLYHQKHKRHAAISYQLLQQRRRAAKERRYISNKQAAAELANV